jgi:DHA1 family bicyclomycin/chloramphenicol resistance-like MFS transporter
VLTSGFNTGAFMVMASASASLMTELLHRPATEFGLYFLLFPIGFFTGNFISTRIGNRSRPRRWCWPVAAGDGERVGQAVLLERLGDAARVLHSRHFITMAQGIAMPYAQVGAMAEIPRFAGTAAGVGVFMQNFGAAIFAQLYGILADGTPRPMVMIAVLCGFLT